MNPKKKSKELKRISRENLNGRYRLSMSAFSHCHTHKSV